jgi:hypothetical protein
MKKRNLKNVKYMGGKNQNHKTSAKISKMSSLELDINGNKKKESNLQD